MGYSADEIIGRPFDTICASAAEANAPFSVHDLRGLEAGKVIEFEARRRDGELFPVEASFSRWQGENGLQYGVVLRDIAYESARRRRCATSPSTTP